LKETLIFSKLKKALVFCSLKGSNMEGEFTPKKEFTQCAHFAGSVCSFCKQKDGVRDPVIIRVCRGQSDHQEESETIGFFHASCFRKWKKERQLPASTAP
jgi:hypothetical protein